MGLALDPLISTKLRIPRVPRGLVARPRLQQELAWDGESRLTLLSAPAGFGKTTLLGEWAVAEGREGRLVAWVSLDEGDNDPVRFLSYLVAALRETVDRGIGEGVMAALHSNEAPRTEALLGALVNEIAALPHDVAVVFDDYHLIYTEAVHSIVVFLLEHLPHGAHLVISSRVDPPLPLSRLRARGQMTELHAPDLRFNPNEAAMFLSDAMGLQLSAEDVAALDDITEGWAAALQLAALSMKGREDVSSFVRSFSGGHRDVFDFLAEEVLEKQHERVRSFLVETAVLDGLSASLCDAVTGRDDGRRVLDGLERENLFLVPLDDERVWYRYHHLFADFLRNRLERERPELPGALHRRASAWCEANGLVMEAVNHALRAEDHERASRLIEQGMDQTWYRGELVTLLGWLRALPEETMRRRPLLLVWYAAVLMLEGSLEGVKALLDQAEDVMRSPGKATDDEPPSGATGEDPQHVLATAAAVRSLHAGFGGDPPAAVEHARRALALLPEDNLNPRPFAALCLAEAQRAAGAPEEAAAAFAEAASLGRAAGHDYIILASMGTLAQLRMEHGYLREADAILRQALDLATERGTELMPAVGRVRMGLGELHYERDELAAAERELSLGVELAERAGELGVLVSGQLALSRVRRARGDAEGAFGFAHAAERLALDSNAPGTVAEATLWMARLRLMAGDRRPAHDLELASQDLDGSGSTMEAERLLRARLLIADDDHDGALRLLDRSRVPDDARKIEALTLRAMALWSKDDKAQAMDDMERALGWGGPEGYVRTFVDEGPAVAVLLSEALKDRQRGGPGRSGTVPAHYLRRLLAVLERETVGVGLPAGKLPEPLSERELEVLGLIASGKSNPQISRDLFIGVGTVKTHVNNVYRKLDAHSRTQAVARARELGVL